MIGFGSLVALIGAWLLMLGVGGAQIFPGRGWVVREPYSTTWMTWVGAALFVAGAFTLGRGLRERRRRRAAEIAARDARRARHADAAGGST